MSAVMLTLKKVNVFNFNGLKLMLMFVFLYCSCSLANATEMRVKRFEWSPSSLYVGQPTTFYWDVENAVSCFGNNKPRSPSGNNGRHIYNEPKTHTTRWYCTDKNGAKIHLSAPLIVRAVVAPPGKAAPISSPGNPYQPVKTNVTIAWPSVSGATSYKLFEGNTQIYSGSGRSKVVNHSQYGQRLYYVQACNSGGCGSKSSHVSMYFYTAPGGVQNLTAAKTSGTVGQNVGINWGPSGGSVPGVVYKVYVNNVYKKQTTGLNYTLNLGVGTNTVKVYACNPNNVGCGGSRTVSVTGIEIPPGKAKPISSPSSPYQPVSTNVTISWPSVSGASSYKLFEGNTQVYSGSSRSKVRNHSQYGQRLYSVQACNSGGCGSKSSHVSMYFYTAPGGVQNLTAAKTSGTVGQNVSITWGPSGGSVPGVVYKVYVNNVYKKQTTGLNYTLNLGVGTNTVKVYACNPNNVGCGGSRAVSVTGIEIPPGKAKPISSPSSPYQPVSTNVTISWPSVSGASSYKLFEGDTEVYSGSSRSKVRNHTQYGQRLYSVQACNSGGCGSKSSATAVFYYTAPGPVQNLTAAKTSGTVGQNVSITWGRQEAQCLAYSIKS